MTFTPYLKTLSATVLLLLAGCQTPSNTLNFTPPSPATTTQAVQAAVVSLAVKDNRPQQEVAAYAKSDNLVKLTASPSPDQLFRQIMQQNLTAQGFRTGNADHANAAVTVNLNQFYAKVGQGNLRYNIEGNIRVDVIVQGAKGQFSKTFNATRSQSGVLNADHDDIQQVLNATLQDISATLYRDREIAAAINQYGSR